MKTPSTDVVVTTRQGKVRGNLVNGVNVFKGIPYAAPPFGVNRFRPPQPVEATLRAYRAAHPGAGAGDLLAALHSDWYIRIPAIRLAVAHATSPAATYMYEFAWRSPQFNGRLGACHGLEVAFVFDTLGNGTEPLLGTNPPQKLADTMARRMCGLRREGRPRLAEVRVEASGHHALRHDVPSSG